MLTFLLGLLSCYIVSAEIITLLSKENVTCVVTGGDTGSSAVFLSPPIRSAFKQKPIEISNWIKDDWITTSSIDADSNVVTDMRWQDFATLDDSVGHALKGSHSIPISICIRNSVSFDVLSEDFKHETWLDFTPPKIQKSNKHCTWYHFTMKKHNNRLMLYSDNTIVKNYDLEFNPYWIYFKNLEGNSTAWKLHQYTFKTATTATVSANEMSAMSVNFTDNLCLSMYVSVDKNSFLEINLTTESGYVETETIIGFNENDSKEWKHLKIFAKQPGLGQVSFFRGLKDQSAQYGYWAIDEVTFCRKHIEVYQVSLKNEAPYDYICQVLDESNNDKPKQCENCLHCDKPGFLGKNCSVSCKDVLGSSLAYCQKHKICQDTSSCFCSWGYKGEQCDQTCAPGTWNMFCKNSCKPECSQGCYPSTGECLTPEAKIEAFRMLEKNLPTEVTMSSTKLHVIWPHVDQKSDMRPDVDISYSFLIECTNKWCDSKSLTVDLPQHKSIGSVIYVNTTTPFTNYKVTISAKLYDQHLEKTYEVVRADPRLTVRNITIFSCNSTTLSLRFALPESPTVDSVYKVWYHEQNSQSTPKYVANVSRCQLWKDFACAQIDHLNSNVRYSIIVEENEHENHGGQISQVVEGETTEHEPDAPDGLEILAASNHEALLSWNYPSFPNGALQKFVVEIEVENTIKHYDLKANEDERNYQFKFPIKYNTDYMISVRSFNLFKGKAAHISARFVPTDPEFSSHKDVLVETCSSICYWLIPTPKHFNEQSSYNLLIIPNNRTNEITRSNLLANEVEDYKNTIMVFQTVHHNDEYIRVNLRNEAIKQFLRENRGKYSLELQDYHGESFAITKKSITYKTSFSWPVLVLMIIFIPLSLGILLAILILSLRSINKGKVQDGLNQVEESTLMCESKCSKNNKFTKIETRFFESYVKRILLGGKQLLYEFKPQSRVTRPTVHALYEKNKNKNKDNDYVSYDYNRVILEKMEGMGSDDYINASYIDGFDRPKAYIATQGPKFCTIRDFWRMIWQEQIETIVMTTNFVENQERKCAEYFSHYLGSTFECGVMLIKLVSEEIYEHYHARYFEVEYKQQIRKVRHFLLRWHQDQRNQIYPNCIVPLIKKISAIRENSDTPILIHCSSGSDRTGTLILCDLALHMARTTKSVDFLALLQNLRDQRPNMISDEKQYILAHLVVLECLMEEENVFKKSITENFSVSIFNEQLKYLKRLAWHDDVIESYSNRYRELNNYLCYPVDGYAKHQKYFTTEQPTQGILFNFWKMVIQEKIKTIVLLNKQDVKMWPFQRRENDIIFLVKEVTTKQSSPIKLSIHVYQMPNNHIIFEREVDLFQANNYDQELYINSTQEFINILETVNETHSGCEEQPILVACSDDITNCGVFVAMDYIIQQCKHEFEADVCNAIRTIRRSGIPFITTPFELQFLYEGIVEYLKKDEKYSNIL